MKKILLTVFFASLLVPAFSAEYSSLPDFGKIFDESGLTYSPDKKEKAFWHFTTDLDFEEAKSILSKALGSEWTEQKWTDKEINRDPDLVWSVFYTHNTNMDAGVFLGLRKIKDSGHKHSIHIIASTGVPGSPGSFIQNSIRVTIGDFPDTKDTGKLDIGL